MEKSDLPSDTSKSISRRPTFAFRVSVFVVLVVLTTRYYAAGLLPLNSPLETDAPNEAEHVPWGRIKPSKSIEWHPCFDGHQCTRLEVPLDWKNKSNARTAAIAVIRRPAKVSVTDERYGGPVLINPGGPGGSGVYLAIREGQHLQDIIDASKDPAVTAKNKSGLYFDIIGFDPRGVNNTTPGIGCFPDEVRRQAYDIQKTALGIITDGGLSFNSVWNQIQAVSGTCSRHTSHDGGDASDIGRYVSTPQVAEDMVAITEALGEWRDEQSQWEVGSCIRARKDDRAIRERTHWRKGKEMIQYIGFSYGTVLGATLATLHPHRIKRFIIDGVADMDDYYAGEWLRNLKDTDSIMDSFYTACHAAGPHGCPIYSAAGVDGTEAIVEQVLGRLRSGPIPVIGTDTIAPDIVTYSDLMDLVRGSLYKPHTLFPKLAQAIYELSLQEPNGTTLAASKQGDRQPFCPTQECEHDGPWSKACRRGGALGASSEASAMIHCTDAPDWTGHSANFHRDKWSKLRSQSRWLGDFWAEITMYCSSLSVRPSYPFQPRSVGANNTAHPIILASNIRDPVTPLRNAHKFAARFNNSVVIEQDDDGHCALAQPSLCTAKLVREYFQTGKVPKGGAKCGRDRKFFDDGQEEQAFIAGLDAEEKELHDAVTRLREASGDRPRAWLGI